MPDGEIYCALIAYHLGLNAYLGSLRPAQATLEKRVLMTVLSFSTQLSGDLESEHVQYILLLVGRHLVEIVLFCENVLFYTVEIFSVILQVVDSLVFIYSECFNILFCI